MLHGCLQLYGLHRRVRVTKVIGQADPLIPPRLQILVVLLLPLRYLFGRFPCRVLGLQPLRFPLHQVHVQNPLRLGLLAEFLWVESDHRISSVGDLLRHQTIAGTPPFSEIHRRPSHPSGGLQAGHVHQRVVLVKDRPGRQVVVGAEGTGTGDDRLRLLLGRGAAGQATGQLAGFR